MRKEELLNEDVSPKGVVYATVYRHTCSTNITGLFSSFLGASVVMANDMGGQRFWLLQTCRSSY